MVAPIYTDPAGWLDWSGQTTTPDDFVALLRTASRAVRTATSLWVYQVDPTTNLPLDDDLRQTMADATCAHISALIALGVDPDAGGTLDNGFESSAKIGSAQVTYTGVEAVIASRQATLGGLCPEAIEILRNGTHLASVRTFG